MINLIFQLFIVLAILVIALLCGIMFGPTLPGISGHEEFAGALIGAAGTIFAGVIAWLAVQRQIESNRQLAKEREQDTYEVICAELRPFVDLYVQVWRALEYAIAGDAERKHAGISLIKAFAMNLAVEDRAKKLEELAVELDPKRKRKLVDVIQTFKMLDQILKRTSNTVEEQHFWLLNTKTMLSHFERALTDFDPVSAALFDPFAKAPLDFRSSAEHVQTLIDNFVTTGVVD
jgi:hypothetical protein